MELAEIAAQLRRPSGAQAAEVADRMNRSNAGVNAQAIDLLEVAAGHRVLEVGPGNGAFAEAIVGTAEGVRYVGIDWSPAMVAAATRRNEALVASGRARFVEGSSARVPEPAASFDRALAVNTLYFWDESEAHVGEIARVLKPGGRLVLAFGDRDFMRDLPFVAHGFRLYDRADAEALVRRCGLAPEAARTYEETERGDDGQVFHKRFILLRARREP